ncbi:MAG: FkbM family methyltransferase [bacterium]|nr:FkbM family methyltransferase [bacterium]
MSFSIKLGNILYKYAYGIYKPVYTVFKNQQDAFEISLLKKHISEGDIVLDIGANIGYYAGILARLVGEKGQVHCFEPDLKNFSHLKDSVGSLNNVLVNNKAVGAKTELLSMYTSKNLNVDHRTYEPEEYDEKLEIQALSIDDYVSELKIAKVDFIKIDIQGFEMQAIKGMERTLAENKDLKIISEFWPYGLKKAGSSVSQYYDFLNSKGFICYLLEKETLSKLNSESVRQLEPLGESHYFNILAIRSNVQ